MKKKSKRRIIYEIAVLVLTVCLLWTALFQMGSALMPKRTTYGAVWSSYLQERKNSVDVLWMGSSRAYCNIIPARIYEKTGITSYVMAGPSQPLSLTYYYLRQSLRTQSPKAVFVEVSGAFYKQNSGYSLSNICYMPAGINRLLAAKTCEKGILEIALYPLEEFHYRIYEIDWGKQAPSGDDGVLLCGYTPLAEAVPQTVREDRQLSVLPGDDQYQTNLSWLRKIAELCEKKGIRCVFFMAPTMQPYPAEAEAQLFADLAALPAAAEDWNDLIAGLDIDPAVDWYDAIHFNTGGAMKFSDYLGEYLCSMGLTPTAGEDEALWQRRVDYFR